MGGDELPFWKELYKEYVIYLVGLAHRDARTPVFWEEAGEADLPPGVIVQEWKPNSTIMQRARQRQYQVIHSTCSALYLDHGNERARLNRTKWCAPAVTLQDVYNYDPGNAENTIGIDATLFGEHVVSTDVADELLFPRLLAVAEVGWTAQHARRLNEFMLRLGAYGTRMERQGNPVLSHPGYFLAGREEISRPYVSRLNTFNI